MSQSREDDEGEIESEMTVGEVEFCVGDLFRCDGRWAAILEVQDEDDAGQKHVRLGKPISDRIARTLGEEGLPNEARMMVLRPPGSERFPSGCMEGSERPEGCGGFVEFLVGTIAEPDEGLPMPVCWRCSLFYAGPRLRVADATPEQVAAAIEVSRRFDEDR